MWGGIYCFTTIDFAREAIRCSCLLNAQESPLAELVAAAGELADVDLPDLLLDVDRLTQALQSSHRALAVAARQRRRLLRKVVLQHLVLVHSDQVVRRKPPGLGVLGRAVAVHELEPRVGPVPRAEDDGVFTSLDVADLLLHQLVHVNRRLALEQLTHRRVPRDHADLDKVKKNPQNFSSK